MANFLGLITIVFIVLKIIGYISWSWWLVISPMLLLFFIQISALIFAVYILWRK